MSLPFLVKKPQMAGIATEIRPSDIKPENEQEDESGLKVAAQDLLDAIESKDVKALAAAIQAAFEICDSMPHEEGPHLDESEEEEME